MKLRYILAAAAVSFVLGLIAHAPAASIYGWLVGAENRLPVRLYGVSGSLLAGSAKQVTRAAQLVAADLRWQLSPAGLLLGRASYRLRADAPPLLFDGDVAVGLGGTVRLSDARASGELRALAAIVGQSFIPVSGDLGIDLESLTLVDQWPRHAQGKVQILGLSWALGREPAALGDYEAVVESGDDGIVATISTLKGTVDVGGTATLSEDGTYALDLQLRAMPDAPPMIGNLLQSLGRPDARGYFRLQRNGRAAPVAPVAASAEEEPIEEPKFSGTP